MPLQTYKADDGKVYVVDYRMKQFRHVPDNHGIIEFVPFTSYLGDDILCEMLAKNLVPDDKLSMLV